MKRLYVVSIVLCLLLASCSWTVKYNPAVGKRYLVTAPEKVTFYKEPSIKSEPLQIDERKKFIVETLVCSENRIIMACMLDSFIKKYPENLEVKFFKIKFESGEIGYINGIDFGSQYVVKLQPPEDLSKYNLFDADYDRVWNAAVDTLNELGFVILHMRKNEGYISTDKREREDERIQVSMRISKMEKLVNVKIISTREWLFHYKDKYTHKKEWREGSVDYYFNRDIIQKMAARLGLYKVEIPIEDLKNVNYYSELPLGGP